MIRPNGVEKQVRPEKGIQIDLKNTSKSAIEAQGFSVYEYSSVQYTSSGFAAGFVYKTIDLTNVNKVKITINGQGTWDEYGGVFGGLLQGSLSNVYSNSLAGVKNFSSFDGNYALFVSCNDGKQTRAGTGGVSGTFKVEFIVDFTTNIATCNVTGDSTASGTYNFSSYASTIKSTYNNIGVYSNSQTSIVGDLTIEIE